MFAHSKNTKPHAICYYIFSKQGIITVFLNDKILVGKSGDKELCILPKMANRHGLITGASGSGKTITIKVMAESFSEAGVPVFLADVKGDLAGTAQAGEINENIAERIKNLGLEDFETKSFPVRFWDLYGEFGHQVRANVEQVGPEILSIMLGLTEAQEGNLAIAFKIAKDENLRLINLEDLRAVLAYVAENRDKYNTRYGNITVQSIGVIQRSLLTLENQGADKFFGEPALDIDDFFTQDTDGRGVINILHAVKLFQSPDLYASFLLWLLTTLFTNTPEVGDLDKPRLVFFFDEAHLLFNGMPSYRLKRIAQVVKLIRSHGIGLYFASQRPTDIPDEVMSQLGNRVQHTLRAYTPAEQKIVRASADSFRKNPEFDTAEAILELGTGEALISFQDAKGTPTIVERATILPPQSQMGVLDDMARTKIINASPLAGVYDTEVDPESAFEIINAMKEKAEAEKQAPQATAPAASVEPQTIPAPTVQTTRPMTYEEYLAATKNGTLYTQAAQPQYVQAPVAETKTKATKTTTKKTQSKIEKFSDRAIGNIIGGASSSIGRKIGTSLIKNLFK